jgi:hypothetical protein
VEEVRYLEVFGFLLFPLCTGTHLERIDNSILWKSNSMTEMGTKVVSNLCREVSHLPRGTWLGAFAGNTSLVIYNGSVLCRVLHPSSTPSHHYSGFCIYEQQDQRYLYHLT